MPDDGADFRTLPETVRRPEGGHPSGRRAVRHDGPRAREERSARPRLGAAQDDGAGAGARPATSSVAALAAAALTATSLAAIAATIVAAAALTAAIAAAALAAAAVAAAALAAAA